MEENKEEKKEEEIQEIVIHITGQVVNQGIVKLKEGARVIDAIEAAGGTTKDADLSKINLAYMLEDGVKIYVPSINDTEESYAESNLSGMGNTSNNQTLRLNINTATVNDLQKLPGIGSSIASRIITYRNENGKFSSIDGLKNVSGIGESKFNNIKAYVYVK